VEATFFPRGGLSVFHDGQVFPSIVAYAIEQRTIVAQLLLKIRIGNTGPLVARRR
jgi:hypothetical protein